MRKTNHINPFYRLTASVLLAVFTFTSCGQPAIQSAAEDDPPVTGGDSETAEPRNVFHTFLNENMQPAEDDMGITAYIAQKRTGETENLMIVAEELENSHVVRFFSNNDNESDGFVVTVYFKKTGDNFPSELIMNTSKMSIYSVFHDVDMTNGSFSLTMQGLNITRTLTGIPFNSNILEAYQFSEELTEGQNIRERNIFIALCIWTILTYKPSNETPPASMSAYTQFNFFDDWIEDASNGFTDFVDGVCDWAEYVSNGFTDFVGYVGKGAEKFFSKRFTKLAAEMNALMAAGVSLFGTAGAVLGVAVDEFIILLVSNGVLFAGVWCPLLPFIGIAGALVGGLMVLAYLGGQADEASIANSSPDAPAFGRFSIAVKKADGSVLTNGSTVTLGRLETFPITVEFISNSMPGNTKINVIAPIFFDSVYNVSTSTKFIDSDEYSNPLVMGNGDTASVGMLSLSFFYSPDSDKLEIAKKVEINGIDQGINLKERVDTVFAERIPEGNHHVFLLNYIYDPLK
ncbi:MAG: hypothetical protein LBB22_01535 [Treponema sp.]|nr:hypothetical protein [Treponema sp.]